MAEAVGHESVSPRPPSGPAPLPAPYHDAAHLLLPPAGLGVATVAWDPRELAAVGADHLLWGEPPRHSSPAPFAAVSRVARREAAVLCLRSVGEAGRRVVAVHRLPPWAPPGGVLRTFSRTTLRGGTLVELARGSGRPRRLDAAIAAAGAIPTGTVRIGAGGGLLQPVQRGARTAMLRAGRPNTPGDPRWAAAGLARVAGVAVVPAPGLLDHGTSAEVVWSLEDRRPGRPPRHLSPRLLDAAVRALSAMPVTDADPAGAARRDLSRLAELLPEQAAQLRSLEDGLAHLAEAGPAVVGHGDVWTGNLLCEGERLTGLVDWDAWAEDTAPGTDLLQLVATAWRQRAGLSLGSAWRQRPWRLPGFTLAAADYWRGLGLDPDPEHLDALGLAWWAREVAGTLTRSPRLRAADAWLAANVRPITDHSPPGGGSSSG